MLSNGNVATIVFLISSFIWGIFNMGIKEKMIDLDLREQSAWCKSENILGFLCETLVFTEAVLLG